MPSPSLGATLSNCGNVLKALLPSSCGNTSVARVMTSGMVTTQSMSHFGEMDNPQPSPKANDLAMDAVHRLNGSGFASLRA